MSSVQPTSIDQFFARPVSIEYQLDAGPGRYRIGLLALSNDLATERDFINMRRSDEVALFVSRVPNEEICSVENLRAMEPELTRATDMLIPGSRLDSVAYSCTSGTVVLGYDTIVERVRAARPGIPVATPITAALAALDLFDVRRISVLTPYGNDVNQQISDYLTASGKEIADFTSFLYPDNDSISRIPPQAIYDAAIQSNRPDAQALFISCTAIRAVEVADSIEKAIGKPVVTANQALYWQALRATGYEYPVDGFGELLRRLDAACRHPRIGSSHLVSPL